MTWFRVDDTLAAHPKARDAGLAAMGLWAVSGAYASQYLTEGFVPAWYVESWPSGKRHATALVRAGLWTTADGGWRFHQWDERQPTKEQVEADRQKTRERQRRWRESRRDNEVSNGVTDDVANAAPSLPGPTQPVVSSSVRNESSSPLPEAMRIEVLRNALQTHYGKPYTLAEARRTAELVLAGRVDVTDRVQYVMAAVRKEPDRFKPASPVVAEIPAQPQPKLDPDVLAARKAEADRALAEARNARTA